MSQHQSSARLPDELIIEIFKNDCLETSDLFSLALVSRKFVDAVNVILYEQLDILLFEYPPEGEDGDEGQARCEYAPQALSVLNTLMDNPKLQQLVERIDFGRYTSEPLSRKAAPPALETTPLVAVSSFLRLCRKVKKVELWGWEESVSELKVIKQLTNVETLWMERTTVVEINFIGKQLPQLRHFHTVEFPSTFTSNTLQPYSVSYPSNLESLSLPSGDFQYRKAFVSANFSTLRKLAIPVDVAFDLDYTQLLQIHTLQLENTNRSNERALLAEAKDFWRSLSKSPSLRCLTLSNCKYSNGYEEALLAAARLGPQESIPTLKTIRFGQGLYLDRVNSLLSGPLGATLHRVVVSECFVEANSDVYKNNEYKFLSGICEERGIEVVFEPW